jgi:RimJ/RimL family protein N-acetyltransferase
MENAVRLREITANDLPVFYEHQSDPQACRMAVFQPRPWPAFLEHWRRILDDASLIKRTVTAGESVVGNIVAFEADDLHQVGYWIGRAHWGHGIATAAVALFLGEVTVRPLHAIVARSNLASRRVLEKNGFVRAAGQAALLADDGVEELLYVRTS